MDARNAFFASSAVASVLAAAAAAAVAAFAVVVTMLVAVVASDVQTAVALTKALLGRILLLYTLPLLLLG